MRETWLLLDSRGLGGIETHVGELAMGLAAANAVPRVLFLRDYGAHPLKDRLSQAGIRWDSLSGRTGDLVRRLMQERPVVLHTHGYKANLLGRLAAKLALVPHVATYHAGERPAGRLAAYDLADRWTSFLGKRIAVSAQILRRLPFGGVLVPNFVDVADRPADAGPAAIGFVGRMVHEKGPDTFCEIAGRIPNAPFLAYGDGPLREALQIAHGDRVRFMGAVAGMGLAWRSIGLLLISSRAEGLPLAALEAMAQGVPVAAFGLGGLPELIEDGRTGFLAPPDDPDRLAACVGRWLALDETGRRAMSHAAWETVSARYSRSVGVGSTRALYPAV